MAERTAIGADTTAGELHDALSRVGADLMLRVLAAAERGSLLLTPQPEDGVTYAEKISKNETRIDWTRSWRHVDCAAAVQFFAGDLRGKRRVFPRLLVPRGHYICVASEDKVRSRRANTRVEILNRVGASFTECHPVYGETGGLQRLLEKRERAAFRWSDRRAAQQIAGNGDWIGGHGDGASSPSAVR